MKCPKCGKPMGYESGDIFCPYCKTVFAAEKLIDNLQTQIAAMCCCNNCKDYNSVGSETCKNCKDKSNWKVNETKNERKEKKV